MTNSDFKPPNPNERVYLPPPGCTGQVLIGPMGIIMDRLGEPVIRHIGGTPGRKICPFHAESPLQRFAQISRAAPSTQKESNMSTTPSQSEQIPAWWSYVEKEAWWSYEEANPAIAKKIMSLVASPVGNSADGRSHVSSDPILRSGLQIEGKALRIAWLLGLVEYDWPTTPALPPSPNPLYKQEYPT